MYSTIIPLNAYLFVKHRLFIVKNGCWHQPYQLFSFAVVYTSIIYDILFHWNQWHAKQLQDRTCPRDYNLSHGVPSPYQRLSPLNSPH